jgi:hypothetical protein
MACIHLKRPALKSIGRTGSSFPAHASDARISCKSISVEFDPSDRKFSEGVSTAAVDPDSPALEKFSGLSLSESPAGKNSDADAGIARRLVAQDFSVGFARCLG